MYEQVKPLAKYLQFKSVKIYDTAFVLHSKCTVVILFLCTLLLSAKQYFGNPIHCFGTAKVTDFENSYCWTMGTYILRAAKKLDPVPVGEGIGSEITGVTERVYLRYYQWVVVMLLMQSIFFYLPSFLWKAWEGKRLQQLCAEIDNAVLDKDVRKKHRKMLFQYFTTDYSGLHLCYLTKYVVCESLNLLISLANILVMDLFFGNFWYQYLKAIATIPMYNWKIWNEASSLVFPKMSKCELKTYGLTGSITKRDLLCLLPLNILNEKIFVFLYGWFLLMTLLAAVKLFYRILTLLSSRVRLHLMRTYLRSMSQQRVRFVLERFSLGDWFLLYKVANNINPVLFRRLMEDLYEETFVFVSI